MNSIGDQVSFLRKQNGMTQNQLARKAAVRQSTISAIETGSHFHTRTLEPILEALGATIQLCTKRFPEGAGHYTVEETVKRVGV